MATYVSDYYSNTVFVTANIEEVRAKVRELIETYVGPDKKFSDPDFGPIDKDPKGESAIFYPSDESVELQGDASVGQYNNIAGLNIDMITWQRPQDFCKDPSRCKFITREDEESDEEELDEDLEEEKVPKKSKTIKLNPDESLAKVKRGGASSLDVMQGNLGDCWFISALALVASRDDLFDHMLCNGEFEEYEKMGLYVFRMFKNCKVHFIVVDDKIPCMERRNGHCFPAFARCRNPNEFWVSLIEKAYAKLNIRYINLTSGFIDEGLQDLTGLAPEMIRFSANVDLDSLWQTLKILTYTGSLIGGSLNFLGRRDMSDEDKRDLQTDARRHGIQYGHAYGVLDVREVPSEEDPEVIYKFLRIKNPWGKENNMEWNGEWNDSDERWTESLKNKYNQIGQVVPTKLDKEELIHQWGRNDNIFIMEFEQFVVYFNTLMAVRDYPDEWSGVRYFTAWDPSYGIPPRGKNWTKNPQFPFHLKNKTSIAVLLQQPDPRSVEENRPPFKKTTLLAVVFKLEQSEKAISVFQPDKIAIQSQGSDSRCVVASGELKPGKYSVILMNSSEGTCSDCYLSIYFSCTKDEIVLENKNWEVILEEEEVGQRNRPSKLDVGKSLASNAINESKEHKNMIKQAMLPNNLQSMVKVKTDDIINPIGKKLVDGVIGQEKKRRSQEETKHLAFGKSASKPVTDLSEKLPTRSTTSYTQGIKELKKTIQNIEVEDDLDNKISNPLDAEIEFERDMAMLLGLDYQDYKTFHTLPTEQQEKIIEEYQDITTQNSTVLDLNYYGLTNKGLNAVLEGIEDFPNLEYLYLRENKLGDISVCDLCRRLELSRQQGIKEIDLGYNENLTDNSGLALVALASRIKSIEKISVDNTEITTKIQQKISEVTERNKKLKNS